MKKFKYIPIVVAIIIAAIAASTNIASAVQRNVVCLDSAKISSGLFLKHQEVPVFAGIASRNEHPVVIYASKNGTFSIVQSFKNGKSCIVQFGHSWINIPSENTKPKLGRKT